MREQWLGRYPRPNRIKPAPIPKIGNSYKF
jgi:hypothetical protein